MARRREIVAEYGRIAKEFLKLVKGELQPHTSTTIKIEGNVQREGLTLAVPKYIQFAKYGRGPGKQPPLANVLEWVKKNNILFDNSTQEGTAFAIAKSIAKKGTSNWKPNAPDAIEEATEKHIDSYNDKLASAVQDVTFEILEEIYQETFPKIIKI